jgi:hypothetical protein
MFYIRSQGKRIIILILFCLKNIIFIVFLFIGISYLVHTHTYTHTCTRYLEMVNMKPVVINDKCMYQSLCHFPPL